MSYSEKEQQLMLQLAYDAIDYGLKHRQMLPIEISTFPESLQENRACFVLLKLNDSLRGSSGSLCAERPLAEDIVYNAFSAAFGDPLFFSLTFEEFQSIDVQILILKEIQPLTFDTEDELIRQLRPEIDGLILTENHHQSTCLPSTWQLFPKPEQFWMHLKEKADLPIHYWSNTLKVDRYTVDSIESWTVNFRDQ